MGLGRCATGAIGSQRIFGTRRDEGLLTAAGEVTCRGMMTVMGGTPVFSGTRVPIQTLLDYLEAGDTIEDSLAGFPTVTREQVVVFLERGAALAANDAA